MGEQVSSKKTNRTNKCLCRCGTPVTNNFAPGHDAKIKSKLVEKWGDSAVKAIKALGVAGALAKLGLRAKTVKTGKKTDSAVEANA